MKHSHAVFFFDRCCGKQFPKGIRPFMPPGCVVVYYEIYGEDPVDDDLWLAECAKQGWVPITTDASFPNSKITMTLIHQFRVGWFQADARWNAAERIDAFRKAIPSILRAVRRTARPFLFEMRLDGHLRKRRVAPDPRRASHT